MIRIRTSEHPLPSIIPRMLTRAIGDPLSPPEPAARFLEGALLFTFILHGLAMVSMALLLLPGMPGGNAVSDASRIAYIAHHPWLWRLGWFPWQVTALSDLLLGIALLRTPWMPRIPALVTATLTLLAIAPDQYGQAVWITRGVTLAQEAVRSGNNTAYLRFEAPTFQLVAGWGAMGYLFGAIGWTWCFAAARTWSRWLTWLSVAVWSVFFFATIVLFLPPRLRPGPLLVSTGNAVGFVLLQLWFILVAEKVLARSRVAASHGRYAPWRHPRAGLLGRTCDLVGNSHFGRCIGEQLPVIGFASDITDVIYVNYLVPADRAETLLPPGLELQRLGPDGKHALFTFLTYRHGHFGPQLLGPARRLLPSPIQSNWRIHVTDPQTKQRGIYFISNCISMTPHAVAARWMSEGMPMHVCSKADVSRDADGTIHLLLDPGGGSAPDARATLRPTTNRELSSPWNECFTSYDDFLAYCVPQDRAISAQPWYDRVTRQEIDLGIALQSCEPLEGEVVSRAASAIAGDARPLCFRVAKVPFRFKGEIYDRRVAVGGR